MSPTRGDPGADTAPQSHTRLVLLLVAALVVVVVPVLAGILLLQGDDDTSSTAASMDGNQAESGSVADFNEILDSEITVTVDATATSALLELTTSIDVVCAVAYGPTGALGFLATDTDMAGAGHANHHPTMVGLDPGTTYFYRLQAIGPDGVLYVSDQMTFSTPTADGATVAERANVAIGASVVHGNR